MNKTWIVAQREFTSRVRKKTFLLSTILLPLLIFGFYAFMIYFSMQGNEDTKIAILDQPNLFNDKIRSDDDVQFIFTPKETEATLKQKVENKEFSGYLVVPAGFNLVRDSLRIHSGKTIGLVTRERIEKRINAEVKTKRLLSLNITQQQLDSAQQDMNVSVTTLGKESSDNKSGLAYGVGFASSFMIYIILFIYGTMVMRGVTEEKVSRIAEVIISSVKPFQLMMGKIVGIGSVGLLQFIIWIALALLSSAILPLLMPGAETTANVPGMPGGIAPAPQGGMTDFLHTLGQINFTLILSCFIFYFLGGYLLYSSLFAAVGSAVNEDPQDAQSLLIPVTMPLIFGIMIMVKAINDPNSGLAVFGSLFPFTSPVVMMARIAHGIPDGVSTWELITSMVLLILGFIFTTWLAAKIYRTGILLYGKKVTWKEMWKWAIKKSS